MRAPDFWGREGGGLWPRLLLDYIDPATTDNLAVATQVAVAPSQPPGPRAAVPVAAPIAHAVAAGGGR